MPVNKHSSWIVALSLFSIICTSCQTRTVPARENRVEPSLNLNIAVPTPQIFLTRIELTNALKGKIGDGGFDTILSTNSGRYFFPDTLPACGLVISGWARQWASKHNLQVYLVREQVNRTAVHVAAPDSSGFFRFYYSLDSNSELAKGQITFHNKDGLPRSLSLTKFPKLQVNKMASDFFEKMKCKI